DDVLHDLFFFSSRRRHTRFSRDWSSDVCSSDLDRSAPSRMGGRRRSAHSRSNSDNSSGEYVRERGSSSGTEASEWSTPTTPVSRKKSHPPQVRAVAEVASRSGSWARNQVSTACGRPAKPTEPLILNADSTTPSRSQASTCGAARPSDHSTAGPVGSPWSSTKIGRAHV